MTNLADRNRQSISFDDALGRTERDSIIWRRYVAWLNATGDCETSSDFPVVMGADEDYPDFVQRMLGVHHYTAKPTRAEYKVWQAKTWRLYASEVTLSLHVIVPDKGMPEDASSVDVVVARAFDEFLTAWNSRWVAERLPSDWKIECDNGWWTCTRPCRDGEAQGVLTEGATLDEALAGAVEHERRWKEHPHE